MQEYVFSVTDRDGTVSWVRVRASSPNAANALVIANSSSAAQIAYRGLASSFGQDQLGSMDAIGGGMGQVVTDDPYRSTLPEDRFAQFQTKYPFQAFQQGIRNRGPAYKDTPLEGLTESQYNPYAATQFFEGALGNQTANLGDFQAYTQRFQGDVNQRSGQLFNQLQTQLANKSVGGISGIPSADFASALSSYNPVPTGDDASQRRQALIRAHALSLAEGSAATKYNPFLAQAILPDEAQLNRRLKEQLYTQGGQNKTVNYVDFLRQQFGL